MTERFSTIPFTPSALPDREYHVANKKYVDTVDASLSTRIDVKNVVSASVDLAMTSANMFVIADDTAGSLSIALPTVSVHSGREFFITNRTGSAVVYIRDGEGGTVIAQKGVGVVSTVALSVAMETSHFICDGSFWYDLNGEAT